MESQKRELLSREQRDDYYDSDSEFKDIAEVITAKNKGAQNGTIE